MHTLRQTQSADILFLIESTSLIGVHFDQIKSNYINSIIQYFYGQQFSDEIGVVHDVCVVKLMI